MKVVYMLSFEIVEVAPRDGLQNEARQFSTDEKVELITRCVAAGAKRVEATSFVSPRAVPQLADADEVMARVPRAEGVSYSALVVNAKGLHRAIQARVDEINIVVIASESLAQANQRATVSGAIDTAMELLEIGRRAGLKRCVTIAASFGCPFEGEVSPAAVMDIVRQVAVGVPDEICLADTIGVATPTQTVALVETVQRVADDIALRTHFHDTRHLGVANAVAAAHAGVRVMDASLGGIGGCPFSPGATGNVATEDLLYVLGREGFTPDQELAKVCADAQWLEGLLQREVPGALSRARTYPPVGESEATRGLVRA